MSCPHALISIQYLISAVLIIPYQAYTRSYHYHITTHTGFYFLRFYGTAILLLYSILKSDNLCGKTWRRTWRNDDDDIFFALHVQQKKRENRNKFKKTYYFLMMSRIFYLPIHPSIYLSIYLSINSNNAKNIMDILYN